MGYKEEMALEYKQKDWKKARTRAEILACIKEILNQPGANVNLRNRSGMTPLHYAVTSNFYRSVVQELLRHPEIDVNVQSTQGFAPLHFAIHTGNDFSVQELLRHPEIDVNVQDEDGETVLHNTSIYQSSRRVITTLLAHPNIDVNVQNFINGETPLHLAVYFGRNKLTKMLLAHPNINVKIQDDDGKTALASLLEQGCKNATQIVKLFLEAGAYSESELDIIKMLGL